MRKILKILSVVCTLSVLATIPAHAGNIIENSGASINVYSELLPATITESMDFVQKNPRGVFFSAADLKISNENGEIGVVGHAYMSTEIDELYMNICLDRKNDDGKWEQVDSFDFEFYAEDYPDGLTSELVAFTLTGYPKRHYYRLRGSFAAIKDGVIEGFSPVTDGVMIV